MSQSHSPFFYFLFSIVVAFRPVTQPPKTSLSDCQLSWKLLRSVFSLLLLLQCIVGSAVRYSKCTLSGQTLWGLQQNQRTNQLLLYIVCVNARWEPSHAARCRKPQSHLYIVLFLMFVCMCVGVCVRVFNHHHPMWKKKRKQDKRVQPQQIWWAEEATSHLQSFYAMNHIWKKRNMRRKKGSENTQMGKVTKSLFCHTWVF